MRCGVWVAAGNLLQEALWVKSQNPAERTLLLVPQQDILLVLRLKGLILFQDCKINKLHCVSFKR